MRHLRRFLRLYHELAVLGALSAAVVIALWVGVIPGMQKVIELWGKHANLTKETAALSQKMSVLDGLDAVRLTDQLRELTAAVPMSKSPEATIATIEAAAQEADVTITSMSIASVGSLATPAGQLKSKEEQKLGAFIQPVTVTVNADLSHLKALVTAIHGMRRMLSISSINFSLLPSTSEVKASIAIESFYAPLPTQLGRIDTPITNLSQEEEAAIVTLQKMPNAWSEFMNSL